MKRLIDWTVRAFIHSQTSLTGSFFPSRSLNIGVSSVLLLDLLVFSFYSHSLGNRIHYQSVHYNKYPSISWIYISTPDLSLELLNLHVQLPVTHYPLASSSLLIHSLAEYLSDTYYYALVTKIGPVLLGRKNCLCSSRFFWLVQELN